MGSGVRSNSNLASGLKFRPRNCPYTVVARRSGVRVIEGREFLNDKDAGRNASEPRSSLVNLMRLPTSCLYREGCHAEVWTMEATATNRRGNRVGMYWKLNCPVLEIHNDGGETADCCVLRRRNRGGSLWKSEGFTVPPVAQGQQREAYPWGTNPILFS